MSVPNRDQAQTDYELAKRAAKLWPNRAHEANPLFALLCRVGIHRWRNLNLTEAMAGKDVRHCFWCSKVKVDGIIYDT